VPRNVIILNEKEKRLLIALESLPVAAKRKRSKRQKKMKNPLDSADLIRETPRNIKGAPCGVRFECLSSTAPEEGRPV
jgi:hypothetical protein